MCVGAVCVGLAILKGGDSFPTVMRSRYVSLLDAALTFINTPLTDEQVDELDRTWSVCRCDMSSGLGPSMHPTTGSFSKDRNLSRVIISLIALLTAALSQVTPTTLSLKTSKGTRKWPPSAAHLLPTGPEGLVRSQLQWQRYTVRTNAVQTYPFEYISAVLDFCPTAQRPVADCPEFASFFAQRFESVVAAFESGERPTLPIFPRPDLAIEHLINFYNALEEFMEKESIDSGSDADSDDDVPSEISRYFAPYAPALYAACKRLLVILHTLQEVGRRVELQEVLEQLLHAFYFATPFEQRPEEHNLDSYVDRMLAIFDEHTLLFTALSVYRDINTCCGPSCFRHAGQGTRLQRCQKCTALVYCSRECQKEHWKWSVAPHKDSCESIGKFFAAFKAAGVQAQSDADLRERFKREAEGRGLSWADEGQDALDALEALDDCRARASKGAS
ncbi:hypothetical protein EXIGLDRAFT_717148 [Exidia glandulosa HHB12029]|uniref:MYND-type domain-containing protein n=1 Tax=Exidia glandulosa HHB12029 TaxID=1314781 RepID=A0A165IHT9_EXIGL|nr:hypothetical protein EXIGLDRAFT_717148 [Exidia glandulosa HHB12029]